MSCRALIILLAIWAGCSSPNSPDRAGRLQEARKRCRIDLVVSRSDGTNPLAATLPEQLAHEIAKLDGVDKVAPAFADVVCVEELGTEDTLIHGWPISCFLFDRLTMIEGQRLSDRTEKSGRRKPVMLGKKLAESLCEKGVKLRSTVTIDGKEFEIIGVYESANNIESNMALMPLSDAQELLGKSGQITVCCVRLKDPTPEHLDAVRSAIEGPLAEKFQLKDKIRIEFPPQ